MMAGTSILPMTGGLAQIVPGAIVIKSAIPVATLDAMNSSIDAGLADLHAATAIRRTDIERLAVAWGTKAQFVRSISALAFRCIAETKVRVAHPLAQSLGEHVDSTLFTASSMHSHGTHAHQDLAYKWMRAPEERYALTAWIPLGPVDAHEGALEFSRTFDREPLADRQDFLNADFVDQASTDLWRAGRIVVEADAGDLVLFDAQVWHAAKRRETPGCRRALALRFRSIDAWEQRVPIREPSIDLNCFGMDTSGRLLKEAIDLALPGFRRDHAGASLGGVMELLRRRLEGQATASFRLAPDALSDLETALMLEERFGARPSAAVWRGVREAVIPWLMNIQTEVTHHALA